MRLFVLRHGMTSAADTDADRTLTDKGVDEVEAVLKMRLGELNNIEKIYSSPLLRVKQTLRVAKRMIGFHGALTVSDHLTTGSRLPEIKSFVSELDFDGGDVLVSSHQSCTSILVLWLTGEDIFIPNGSLLAIDVDRPERAAGEVLWQVSHNGEGIKRTSGYVDQI
ncbi:MAG: histidine phosphatase family protein [Pseudomonadota bacterium]